MDIANLAGALPGGAVWRKSSHSGAGNDCVEVALTGSGAAVRDSKNPQLGALVLSSPGWRTFLDAARDGSLSG